MLYLLRGCCSGISLILIMCYWRSPEMQLNFCLAVLFFVWTNHGADQKLKHLSRHLILTCVIQSMLLAWQAAEGLKHALMSRFSNKWKAIKDARNSMRQAKTYEEWRCRLYMKLWLAFACPCRDVPPICLSYTVTYIYCCHSRCS